MNHAFAVLKRHWKSLLGLNSMIVAATLYAATVYADKTFTPVWTASAQINIPTTEGDFTSDLGTLGNLREGETAFSREINPLQVQSTIITSDAVVNRLLEIDPESDLYADLGSYKGLFEVTPEEQSSIISIEAQGSTPELARQRVARLIELYQQRLDELRRFDATAREQFAQEELERAQARLSQIQNNLTEFQQNTGLVNSDAQTQEIIKAVNELKTRQTQVIAEARARETEAKEAATYLGVSLRQAVNSLRLAENQEYQAIRAQLSQVELALADARSKYTSENPQVQLLQLQRQELRTQLEQQIARVLPGVDANRVDTTIGGSGTDSRVGIITDLVSSQVTAKGLQQQAEQMQNQINTFNNELSFISQNQAKLSELQRKYDIAEGVYKGIVAQINQAKINTFDTYPNVQIIDGPDLDPTVLGPNRKLIVLGGVFASLFGSISLVSFLESRKPLLSPKDLQQVELPVLGRISRLKQPNLKWDLEADAETEFQRLASAISFLNLENRRLMIASAGFGEGKTTIALGTAIALVKLGFRVLVVDGDLRKAQLSQRLGYSQVDPEVNSGQILVPVYPGLDLMSAPLISTDKICEFARGSFERRLSLIQESGGYDYVVVDSAPVSLVSETPLMGAAIQNVVFVVRPGHSDRYAVMDSLEQLERHHAQVKGLVINGVESKTEGYRYGRRQELLEAEA